MARPRRLPSFSYCGRYRYSITICACEQERPFVGKAFVAGLLAAVRRAAQDEAFDILAHCFMPDHLHLLVEGLTSASDLRRFVRIAKQRCEYFARRQGVYPLWHRGYFERVLRSRESTEAVAKYIISNPVRAGLVAARLELPFTGRRDSPW